jgi:hypothetical protein
MVLTDTKKGGEMKDKTDDKDDKIGELPAYGLKHSEIASTLPLGQGDLDILQMYKHVFNRPMVAVLHYMIGTAAMCWEEHHIRIIKEMREKLITNEKIIVAYIEKFGRIKPKS